VKESNLLHIKAFLFYSIYLLFSFLIIFLVFFLTGGFDVPLPINEEVLPPWLELVLKEKANRKTFSAEELFLIKSAAANLSMFFYVLFDLGYSFGFSFILEYMCSWVIPWPVFIYVWGEEFRNYLELQLWMAREYVLVPSEIVGSLFILLEMDNAMIIPREMFPNLFPRLNVLVYSDFLRTRTQGLDASSLFYPVRIAQLFDLNPRDLTLLGGHFSNIYNPWIIQIISSIMGNDVSVLFSQSNPLSMLSLQSTDIMPDTVAIKEEGKEEIVVNRPWEAFFVPYVWLLEVVIGYLVFLCLMIDFFLHVKKNGI
jgi:hypothetical protein